MLHAVAFCTRVCVKFKWSGTVVLPTFGYPPVHTFHPTLLPRALDTIHALKNVSNTSNLYEIIAQTYIRTCVYD